MVVLVVRVARIVLLLVLSVTAISLVIGLFRPETGPVEKVVLAVMFAGCFALAFGITSAARRLRMRLGHR